MPPTSLPPEPTAGRGTMLMLASAGCFIANALVIRMLGARFAVDSWLLSSVRFVVGLALIVMLFPPGRVFQFNNLYRNPQLIIRGVLGGIGTARPCAGDWMSGHAVALDADQKLRARPDH